MSQKNIPMLRIPTAAYRLQFNYLFTFSDAAKIIPYLFDLGITDIYSSPYFMACKGSIHGYDIVNHSRLNHEIGTEEEYNKLIDELHLFDMGQILDIVPNHMCITSKDNIWWMDVLENGPSSIYADFFDIDWAPVKKELKNKVLLPFLGDQYGTVLENGELTLFFEEGSFFIRYYENLFPVRPQTYIHVLEHRMEDLKKIIKDNNPSLMELLSIITALKNLPSFLEKTPEKINERNREKEIAKKRLWALYREDTEVKSFINKNIEMFNGIKGDPKSFSPLDRLLAEQIYRLSYWPVATEEINYRRFFDINDLAAIKMENPIVFEETHKLLFRLIRERKITGLRIDHPDGLYSPSGYFHCLQKNCFRNIMLDYMEKIKKDVALPHEDTFAETEILNRYDEMLVADPESKPFYIVGEKILIKSEKMPEEWPIFSTTGYVFLNSLNGIFIETRNAKVFEGIYSGFIKSRMNYQDKVYDNKRLIMKAAMASEINTLGNYLNRISEKNRHTRDFTLNSLIEAITEVIAYFPVYRTYINNWEIKERDHQYIDVAVSKAKRRNPSVNASIFDFLYNVLLLRLPDTMSEDDKNECLDFVMKFQQVTGPVMAKGVEDTTFYIYNRLLSLNEVGGSPDRFGTPIETFHGQNIERNKFWPHALITSFTHDSKRSDDTRARINVLSEIPDQWRAHLLNWSKLNKNKKVAIDGQRVPGRNEEYFFYQTLIGSWPINETNEEEYEIFKTRIKDYMLKAMREAKVYTSWTNPHLLYEEAMMIFIETVMMDAPDNIFLKSFIPFQKMISHYGIYNSLSQTLLKITSPGIPDFYQGTELLNFSLVDPDNRRPVDYDTRIRMLKEIKRQESLMLPSKIARELTLKKEDGMIKMYLIYKSLGYRRANKVLFEQGEYIFLETFGEHADNICAFARRYKNTIALSIVPRFFTRLSKTIEDLPLGIDAWNDTVVAVLSENTGKKYRNIFTNEVLITDNYNGVTGLSLAEVFKDFPVALLDMVDTSTLGCS
jgi:(1->4)-alpha-D-glucan 1-alpha-D-glucosylmutase